MNKWKKGKTTKTKKVLNPNIMFTMFGVFCDKLAGAVRKELCEWISANLESFKRQCFMGMASKDMDFDDWFAKLKSNDTVCDEFGLSALCQAFQRHAQVVTSHKIWLTIPANHGKTADEERRLCDVHFLYMYRDTYACLEPKFQWKRELPLGEVQLIPSEEPKEGPLTNIMEKILDTESNNQNIIKEETVTDNEGAPPVTTNNVIDELGLVSIPPLPSTNIELLDATQNLLVPLPIDTADDQELVDTTATIQPVTEPVVTEPSTSNTERVSEIPITIPCSINLSDIAAELKDGKLILPKPIVPLELHVISDRMQYDLRSRTGSATENNCAKRRASMNINYEIKDATTEDEDPSQSESEKMNLPAKSGPSGYCLASHKYMLAKRRGLVQGPAVRTKALKIPKSKIESTSSIDSEAMEEYLEPPAIKKRTRKVKKKTKPSRKGTLVTRNYILCKDGKGTSLNVKPKRKHKFRCPKCQTFCISVKALNGHFKTHHRKVQCKICGKFFLTPGAAKLHSYTHQDGQFECMTCKHTFAFKSQLAQHRYSHTTTRQYKCPEKDCDRSFTHEHDLKKHEKSHSGEVHYCTRCDYSNEDGRLLNQHMNKHLRIKKYFCKMCKKGFIYSNQLKRHYDKGC